MTKILRFNQVEKKKKKLPQSTGSSNSRNKQRKIVKTDLRDTYSNEKKVGNNARYK